MFNYRLIFWIFFALFIIKQNVFCEEILIQIFAKKPINIVSDKFISYSIEPKNLMSVCGNPSVNFTKMIKSLGPAYFKVAGSSPTDKFIIGNTDAPMIDKSDNIYEITSMEWKALNDWMSLIKFTPIIALDYNPKLWHARDVIRTLGITNNLGIKNCLWQLGADFNHTIDAINYVDHLTTLRTIVDSFLKFNNKWGIIGGDLSVDNNLEEIRLYAEMSQYLVDAIGWTQSQNEITNKFNDSIALIDPEPKVLKNLLKGELPIWLNLNPLHMGNYDGDLNQDFFIDNSNNKCTQKCLENGINWAQTLGDTAKSGFKVIYTAIDKNDILKGNSLTYYVTKLYKQLMGEIVFDTKILNGDKKLLNFYTHCSKNLSGSFSVMGINPLDTKIQITTKISTKFSGSEIRQYILSVTDETVRLNGDTINIHTMMEPFTKMKRPNRPITFLLPPKSIGFWLLPLANLKECLIFNDSIDGNNYFDGTIVTNSNEKRFNKNNEVLQRNQRQKTSSELLLQELIMETINKDLESQLLKRHVIVKKDSKHLQPNTNNNVSATAKRSSTKAATRNKRSIDTFEVDLNNDGNYIKLYDLTSDNNIKRDYRNTDDGNDINKRSKRCIIRKNSENGMRSKRSRKEYLSKLYDYRQNIRRTRKAIQEPSSLKPLLNNLPKQQRHRIKRQITNGLSRLFEKFDFKKSQFNINKPAVASPAATQSLFKLNSGVNKGLGVGIQPVHTIHNIFRINSAEKDLFKSSENKNLPNGDVYFEMGPDTLIQRNNGHVKSQAPNVPHNNNLKNEYKQKEIIMKDEPDDINLRHVPDQFFEYVYNEPNSLQPTHENGNNNVPPYGELWEAEVYQQPLLKQTTGHYSEQPGHLQLKQQPEEQQQLPIVHKDDINLGYVLKELQPTQRKNYENLMKTKQDLTNYYLQEDDRISLKNSKLYMPTKHEQLNLQKYQQQDEFSDDDQFFDSKRRKRRSINSNFNDIIEERIQHNNDDGDDDDIIDDDFVINNINNHSKLNFLDKIFRIIENIDKIDEFGNLYGFKKLHDKLNEIENIIQTQQFNKFNLKTNNLNNNNYNINNLIINDLRKKCKILSMNLEKQCLNDETKIFTNIMKTNNKLKKSSYLLKKNNYKNMLLNRHKRDITSTLRKNSSWEIYNTNGNNLIPKEFKTGGDTEYNKIVPSIDIDHYNYNAVNTNIVKSSPTSSLSSSSSVVPTGLTILHKTSTTADNDNNNNNNNNIAIHHIDIIEPIKITSSINSKNNHHSVYNHLDTINNDDNNNIAGDSDLERDKREKFHYDSPKFMKIVTQSVNAFMDMVNLHISGWWNMIT